ncbi:hypothetical protein yc1106_09886 [Curvularia clavata]|uniref:Uncharacterized protein n=1 Tax=Curvularia clavata TaxID=95742 RepID=A0A9Q9DX66_CURCL|nr:hypothetical protein yc1106_09886 [Curvularia clavata]
MLSTTLSANILTTLVLFTSSTLAVPTRTHCQCKIVSNTDSISSPPAASYTPSAAHWTPANPSSDEPSSPIINDICTSLGSQLEKFRTTDPELYDLYMRGASPSPASSNSLDQKPIPTSVLLSGNQEAMHDYSPEDSSETEPKEGKSRIVCFSTPRSSSQSANSLGDFHSSPLALCALQLIVLFSILACVVEGIHLLKTYIQNYTSPNTSSDSLPAKSLRLTGSEQRLLAIPNAHSYPQDAMCCSPGAEKKLRAYEEAPTRYFASSRGGRREFIAYDDDSDDEANRPVM